MCQNLLAVQKHLYVDGIWLLLLATTENSYCSFLQLCYLFEDKMVLWRIIIYCACSSLDEARNSQFQ